MKEDINYDVLISGLMSEITNIQSVSIISSDGLMLASNSKDVDTNKLAALSAAMLGLAKKSASEMSFGSLQEIHIHGSESNYLIYSLDQKRIITIVLPNDSNIGLVNLLVRKKISEYK